MNNPVAPPLNKELHHHMWSSLASWKYDSAMVMKDVTITSIMNARNNMPNNVYILWPQIDANMWCSSMYIAENGKNPAMKSWARGCLYQNWTFGTWKINHWINRNGEISLMNKSRLSVIFTVITRWLKMELKVEQTNILQVSHLHLIVHNINYTLLNNQSASGHDVM